MKKIKLLLCFSFARQSILKLAAAGLFIFYFSFVYSQGTWTALNNPAPISAGGGMVLLTDGRVMCKGYIAANSFPITPDNSWMVLTPDIHGSYANGTWSVLPPANYTRSVFGSVVLPNGNVYIAGGEHGSGGSSAEEFNTVSNTWSDIPNIPGYGIYDANAEILYDGSIIEGCALIYNPDTTIMIYSPVTGNLTHGPASIGSHEETSWLKLPDSSILYVNTITTTSERYIPKQHKWVADANVPVPLYDPSSEETGPAVLLPNGKGFFIGDVGYTAIYTPSGNASPGTWTTGPNEPFSVVGHTQLGSWDGPCAMMVNGKVLYSISPLASESLPSFFYEFDYTTNTFTLVGAPGGWGDSVLTQTNMMTMLDLPDGTVLFAYTDSTKFYIYTPGSPQIPQGIPTINAVVADSCNKWMITGKLFNGISEGAEFGDDWQMSTNYPVIRVTNGTDVYYAKTTNWNRIGAVQTDSLEDTAYFTFPTAIPGGTYSLVVTANGFASKPTLFTTFGVSITSSNTATCVGGSATVTASNGVLPYTYLWSPSGGTNATASNLSAGTYTVTVTEGGGCSVTVPVTITGVSPLSICGGSPTTVNFSYTGSNQTWTVPVGVNSITITAMGGSGAANPANTSAGGLGGSTSGTLAVAGGQVLQVNVGGAAVATAGGWNGGGAGGTYGSCSGGNVDQDGGGGGGESDVRITPYAFANVVIIAGGGGGGGGDRMVSQGPGAGGGGGAGWFGGGGGGAYTGGAGTGGTQVAGGTGGVTTITGYSCEVPSTAGTAGTGGAGALTTTNAQTATITGGNAGGAGGGTTGTAGSATLVNWQGGGGGGGSSYIGGVTAASTTSGVNAGNGSVLIAYLLPNMLITNVSCFNGSNGSLAPKCLSGGVPPYTYLWAPGGQTTESISGLSAGTYTLTIHDSCGSSVTATVAVTQPNLISIARDSINNLHCHSYSNGTATVFVNPGTPPYTYHWSPNGGTNATGTGLSIGTYTVTVTDSCGNTADTSITITAPPALAGTIDSINVSSTTACNGKAWVTPSGGTPPYTYLWTTGGQTTDTITGQCAGNYCCLITDNGGCVYPLCVDILVTGIASISSSDGAVSIYPNPNNGIFNIVIASGAWQSHPMVEIYNVLGEKVYSKLTIDNSQLTINLSNQPNGVYFYRVLSENGELIGEGKVVIQK